MTDKKGISVVIPAYNEAGHISRLYQRLKAVLSPLSQYRFEYLFINDGSTDATWQTLSQHASEHPDFLAIDLSRNFGKEIALSAGLDYAHGDAVIFIDADLQHPPEIIPELIRKWEEGAEVVGTIRKKVEKHSWLRRLSSHAYYWLMRRVSDLEMVSQTTDFRLIDRKVANELRKIQEKGRMFRGLIDWVGFRKVWVEFDAAAREEGSSNYSYRKLFDLALNSLLSYSQTPLKLVAGVGILITLGSGALLVWMFVAQALISEQYYYTPLAKVVVFNSLMMGIVLAFMGIISLYVGKIYLEVVRRPLYIVREARNLSAAGIRKDSGSQPPLIVQT